LTQLESNPNTDVYALFLGVIWGTILTNVGIHINYGTKIRRIKTQYDIKHNIIDGKWHDSIKLQKK